MAVVSTAGKLRRYYPISNKEFCVYKINSVMSVADAEDVQ